MTLLAINGSPRKNWNTATLLNNVILGAKSNAAVTELVHLSELKYSGCISCFSCKLKNGKSYGKCAVKDDLSPILEKLLTIEALVVGSPIYLGSTTGMVRSFFERLIFPYIVYDKSHTSLFKRKIKTGLIYTMNAPENAITAVGYDKQFESTEAMFERIFGCAETIKVHETYQFDDYGRYESSAFNEEERRLRKERVFPVDCQKAFDMGVRLTKN